jgi:hypothetical protein
MLKRGERTVFTSDITSVDVPETVVNKIMVTIASVHRLRMYKAKRRRLRSSKDSEMRKKK